MPHAALTRREALLAALVALPTIGCGSEKPRSRPGHWDAGTTTGIRADTWVERKIQLDPGGGERTRESLFLRLGKDGGVLALSPRCTCRPNRGSCPVRWIESTRKFVCPCHGGVYEETGEVLGGPPEQPLEFRPATVENRTVYIGFQQR